MLIAAQASGPCRSDCASQAPGVRALGAADRCCAGARRRCWCSRRAAEPSASTEAAHPLPELVSAAGLLERSGVRVVRVAATGGGGLLDLRYQVVDPGKAAAIHDAETPPALVDERDRRS